MALRKRRKRKKVAASAGQTLSEIRAGSDVQEGPLAHYRRGDIVEIWSWLKVPAKKGGGDATDPNVYAARCLTSGHAPVLEVIDEESGERHPRFPTSLFEGQYTIWKVLV